jgi:hypothetical protein
MKQFAASTSSGYLVMAPASFDQETPLVCFFDQEHDTGCDCTQTMAAFVKPVVTAPLAGKPAYRLLVRDAFVAWRGSASFVSGTSRWWSPFSLIRGKSTPELPQSGSRAPSLVAH